MELAALTVGIILGVTAVLCLGARLRHTCLNAHTASLRDRDEFKYSQVRQSV